MRDESIPLKKGKQVRKNQEGAIPTKMDFIENDPSGRFSLKEWKNTFLEIEDLTEYEFATAILGDWQDWLKFKTYWPEFRNEILPIWKEELKVKLNSKYLKQMLSSMKEETNLAALKWFMEGKYTNAIELPEDTGEIKKLSKAEKSVQKEIEDDLARVKQSLYLRISNDSN